MTAELELCDLRKISISHLGFLSLRLDRVSKRLSSNCDKAPSPQKAKLLKSLHLFVSVTNRVSLLLQKTELRGQLPCESLTSGKEPLGTWAILFA